MKNMSADRRQRAAATGQAAGTERAGTKSSDRGTRTQRSLSAGDQAFNVAIWASTSCATTPRRSAKSSKTAEAEEGGSGDGRPGELAGSTSRLRPDSPDLCCRLSAADGGRADGRMTQRQPGLVDGLRSELWRTEQRQEPELSGASSARKSRLGPPSPPSAQQSRFLECAPGPV